MSSAGVVATLDTTAMGRSTVVRAPRVGAISASGIQMYSRQCASGRRAERVSEAPTPRGACRIQLGDDVAPLVMHEVSARMRVGIRSANKMCRWRNLSS